MYFPVREIRREDHTGLVFQRLHDGNQRAQAVDWALLDIFAPFRAEYFDGREFGNLWSQ
jgi:hypothetical protein